MAKPPQTAPEIGVVEVGVGADDHRVLAAQLQHRALQLLRADLADLAADLDRAGEEDLAGAGAGQRVADRAAAVDDADQALGQAALLEDAADRLAQQRRQAGRLEHDAVARHQRDRDLAEGDRPGVVPGRDHADDARSARRRSGFACVIRKACDMRTFSSARILGPALAHQCSASTVGSSSIV